MMPGSSQAPVPHDVISARAAEIFARQRFGVWNDADQAELDAWLVQSALHEAAYLRLKGASAYTEKLFALQPRPAPGTQSRLGKVLQRRFMIPLLAAASIALVATLSWPFVNALLQPPDRTDSTDIGGRTLLSFADRSQVELNTNSAMRFRMTTAERIVWLEKGEAWFHVTHDAAHPFTVIVGRHRITDLGTEFLVRRDGDSVEVTLVNGRAALSAEGVQTATLNPGDDAVATPLSLSVTKKTPQQMADALAWRSGMLVFRNAPLSEVVRQFNRYNTTKLVIADPSIADEKVAVNARTNDYESFLQFATDALKLRIDRQGNEIFISRGPREQGKRAAHIKRSR